MNLAILAATMWEIKPLINRYKLKALAPLQNQYQVFGGQANSIDVLVSLCGVGLASAQKASHSMIQTYNPAAILNVGFAGGLNSQLNSGDFIIESHAGGLDLAALSFQEFKVKIGSVVSSQKSLSTPQQKNYFYQRTNALAVDMEWDAIKAESAKSGVPCAAIKIISDSASEVLPMPRGLSHHFGPLTTSKVLFETLKDPLSIFRTIPYAKKARYLSHRLCDFITELLPLACSLVKKYQPNKRVKVC